MIARLRQAVLAVTFSLVLAIEMAGTASPSAGLRSSAVVQVLMTAPSGGRKRILRNHHTSWRMYARL